MKPSVIVWDLETVPDLGGFAAANDLVEWISRRRSPSGKTATPSVLIKVRSVPTIETRSRSTARRTMVPFRLNFGQRMAEGIAQSLNLEREFHHTASKLRILGFEPPK
jgi:hypothetical protein